MFAHDAPLANVDRRLGARIAFGPPPTLQAAQMFERLGTEMLLEEDNAFVLLLAGLMVRCGAQARELAERAA